MTFGRTGLKIGLFDAELSNCGPLWGDGRKEKIEFDQKKCVFDILSSNDFVFYFEKTKLLDDKIAKTHFFWSNSIFSLRLTPFRGRSLKFCFIWSYFELCATLKHEKSIFCQARPTLAPSDNAVATYVHQITPSRRTFIR